MCVVDRVEAENEAGSAGLQLELGKLDLSAHRQWSGFGAAQLGRRPKLTANRKAAKVAGRRTTGESREKESQALQVGGRDFAPLRLVRVSSLGELSFGAG